MKIKIIALMLLSSVVTQARTLHLKFEDTQLSYETKNGNLAIVKGSQSSQLDCGFAPHLKAKDFLFQKDLSVFASPAIEILNQDHVCIIDPSLGIKLFSDEMEPDHKMKITKASWLSVYRDSPGISIGLNFAFMVFETDYLGGSMAWELIDNASPKCDEAMHDMAGNAFYSTEDLTQENMNRVMLELKTYLLTNDCPDTSSKNSMIKK